MSEIAVSNHGVVAAPNRAVAETGRLILIEGGNAYEAMVGMAATLGVVAPETATLGGDAVWLVREPSGIVRCLDACGKAGAGATLSSYHRLGHYEIPGRGPLSVVTVPGAVDGWRLALEISAATGGRLPLDVLFGDAVRHARDGFVVSRGPDWTKLADWSDLKAAPGFPSAFLVEGKLSAEGDTLAQPKLADTLEYLTRAGLADAYRGDIAREIVDDLDRIGAPLSRDDLRKVEARLGKPLPLRIRGGAVYGAAPQGLTSLVAMGVLERLGLKTDRDAGFVHGVVEAVKLALAVSLTPAADPDGFHYDPAMLLTPQALERETGAVDSKRAAAGAARRRGENAVWMGAVDVEGRAVSYSQSLGAAFGSGCVLPATGVLMGNRGAGFSLDPDAFGALAPGRRPPHGPSPALATMTDGRVVVSGADRPERQAAVFVRHVGFGRSVGDALAQAVARIGQSVGKDDRPLELGPPFDDERADRLERLGHRVVALDGDIGGAPESAGLIVRTAAGRIEGGYDPRSDGCALGL